MIYKDKDNKVYSALKVDDDMIQQIIDDCVDLKSQTSPLKEDELSVRRNEKMRRNIKRVDTFKKVAVASLSIAATGAIIAGVATYKDRGTTGVAKDTQKQVVETTTEYVEETKEKNKVEALNVNEAGIKVDKNEDINYEPIYPETYSGDSVVMEGENEIYKYHDYVFTLDRAENTDELTNVTYKKEGEAINHEISGLDSANFASPYTFANGKYIYYCHDNRLYKYNLETNDSESMILFNEEDTSAIVDCIHDGKLLIDISTCKEVEEGYYSDTNSTLVSYDIKSGKTQVAENRDISEYIGDGYFITFRTTKFEGMKDAMGQTVKAIESCVEEFTDTGFEEVARLGNHSRIQEKSGEKIYFVVYGENKEDKTDDETELTFKVYDKNTRKIETVGKITSEELGIPNGSINLEKMTDEYVEVSIGDEDGNAAEYRYSYATKKTEKISN